MDLTGSLPQPLQYTCERCKATVLVRTHGLCRSVMCGKCRSLFLHRADARQLTYKRPYSGSKETRYLEPGDEGVLFDRRYLVVGWIAKRENGTTYTWSEYHLFNPVHGFAQLSVYNGHWTFHEQLRVYPVDTHINKTLIFDRNVYEPYNRYSCIVKDALGEFTHDIHDQQRAKVQELISPPYMLTRELDDDELAWYLGQYVEPSMVQKAFGKKEAPPRRIGVGACQPMELAIDKNVLLTLTAAFVGVMLIAMMVLHWVLPERTVMDSFFSFDNNTTPAGQEQSSPSFELTGVHNNVELRSLAEGVDNSWFELSGALINNTTGEARSFVLAMEYYHGYEGGESWSEGSRKNNIVFSALPAGTYHIEMNAVCDAARPVRAVRLVVLQNVAMWSNFFLILVIGLLYPLITWWRVQRFEQARWGD